MSYLRFSFTLFMVIASAFIMIYVVEGYYESLQTSQTSAPGVSAEIPAHRETGLIDKIKGFLKVREEPRTEMEPSAFPAAVSNQPEVHHGICVAAMTGDLEKTKALLDAGVSPNARDTFGIRAITRAALWGHYDVVKTLLDHGALVNEKERLGVTLLMLAANQGDEKLLRLFLERGAEKDVRSDDGETALTTAARKGHWNLVAILKESGAQVPANIQEPVLENQTRINPESPSFAGRLFARNREKNPERTYEVEREVLSVSQVKNEDRVQAPRESASPAGEFLPFSPEEDQALSLDALTWAANVSQSSIQNEAFTFQESEETVLPVKHVEVSPPEAAPRITFTERSSSQKPPVVVPAQVSQPLGGPEEKTVVSETPPFTAPPAPLPGRASLPVPGKARKIDLSKVPTEEEMLELALLNINEKRVIPLTEQVPAVQPLPPVQTASESVKAPSPSKTVLRTSSESPRKAASAGEVDFFSVKKPVPAAVPLRTAPVETQSQRKAADTSALSRDLLQACLLGDEPRVRKLVHLGADVNIRGDLEMTPLMIAAQGGHAGIVRLLLEKGADVRAQNVVGQTALRLAELRDRQSVIHALRGHGASV